MDSLPFMSSERGSNFSESWSDKIVEYFLNEPFYPFSIVVFQ